MDLRALYSYITLCLVISTMAINMVSSETCGDKLCKCSRKDHRATCQKNKKDLNYIPTLPSYIRQARFSRAYFPNLTTELFTNLSSLKLESLSLQDTSTFAVMPDAFRFLPNLKKLEVTRVSILQPDVLSTCLKSLSRSIEKLFLQNNRWSNLPDDMFNGLQSSNLSHIDLKNNRLQKFNGSILLSRTPYLRYLDLSKNNIFEDSLQLGNMKYLLDLDLRDNTLGVIPSFCDHKQNSLLPRLRTLNLDNNAIKHFKNLKCLPKLWTLHLNSNSVTKLLNNTFANLPSISNISLQNLVNIKDIEVSALNASSLRRLWFVSNKFHFDKNGKYNPAYLFKFCSNLTFLDLENNHLPSNSHLRTILYPLTKLKKLIMSVTSLSAIYKGTFDRMTALEELVLSGNSLSSWHEEIFSSLTSLRRLLLDANDITLFNKSSISANILNNLETLNLGNNPFTCSCEQLWFRDWLKTTNISLGVYPQRYTCKSPPQWKGIEIPKFNYTEADCIEKNPWIMVAIVLSSAGASCILILGFTCFHLPTIKNVLYLIQLKKKGYVKLVNEQYYEFDAFTVYCPNDESWVCNTLMQKLEETGLKLCIKDRDFGVGDSHADDIETGINNSRKCLVILSNEFAKNEWCQWQIELVQERVRRYGKNVVVLILLQSIDSKSMTSSLRSLLNMTSYVSWSSGRLRQNLFWEVVFRALKKPLGNPPVSVL